MKSSEIEMRRYQLITPVHPETVVRWFLDLHHHWFDGSFGANAFYGMRDLAETYLSVWVTTGELPPDDNTMLQIQVASKFEEWLKSSWLVTTEFSALAEDDVEAAVILRELGTQLRTLDVFPCKNPAHDNNLKCECFWERIERWLAGKTPPYHPTHVTL